MTATHDPTAQTLVPQSPPGRTDRPIAASYLVVLAGPAMPALELDPRAGAPGLQLGRHENCQLRLKAEEVSRRHAVFTWRGDDAAATQGGDRPSTRGGRSGDATGGIPGGWTLSDAGSRWGTWLNGRRLGEGEELPIRVGDQIRITPWTFLLSATPSPRGLHVAPDDATLTSVRQVTAESASPMQQDRLRLLLAGAATLHDAHTEADLSQRLLKLAKEGTRLANGAVLRPLDAEGRFDVLASAMTSGEVDGTPTFSRSLLEMAKRGEVAELCGDDTHAPTSQSIVQMQITRALCIPVMLGAGPPAMYLYLDQRGETVLREAVADQEHAAAFCVALGRIASLALSNLKRVEMERRAAELDAELSAAAAAQRWILPKRQVTAAGFEVLGESRPGRGVGGDFFDLIELDEHTLAVALGDVSGKGAAAGVLMTATQGFLHALLQEERDPARALRQLNAFVYPRRPANRFVTLWVGLFDRRSGTLSYVDAGHGYALLRRGDGSCHDLAAGGGLPIGVLADAEYAAQSIPFAGDDVVLVVSDGLVEQPADGMTLEDRDELGMDRVREVLCGGGSEDIVASLFATVIRHAGTEKLADDATAVLVSPARG